MFVLPGVKPEALQPLAPGFNTQSHPLRVHHKTSYPHMAQGGFKRLSLNFPNVLTLVCLSCWLARFLLL